MMKRFINKKVEVHYHKNCTDGMMSAYLLWKYLQPVCTEMVFVPVQYNMDTTVLSENVDTLIIVDYSYSVEQTEKYKSQVSNVVFMDHHLTAAKDHGGYCFCEVPNGTLGGLFTKIIKEERSGAGLTLDFLEDLGFVIDHSIKEAALAVEDRDLWNFYLPNTKYWSQLFSSTPITFEAWNELLSNDAAIGVGLGKARVQVEQYEFMVSKYAKLAITVETAHGPMALINCASDFASSVGETLSKTHAFACMFVVSPKDKIMICSLRSNKETGVDVSAIAKKLDGGGHRNAAGCSFSISDAVSMTKLMDGTLFN